MDLANLIARCRTYERRAAEIYRAFAARTRAEPEVCKLWTALARDEEEHALTLERAGRMLEPTDGWRVSLEGWDEAIAEIDERMEQVEDPRIGADFDRQLTAALALERTEIDHLYHRLAALTRIPVGTTDDHLDRLLAAAERRTDPAVQIQVGMLRARMRLARQPGGHPDAEG
jgi:rubrerythrin